MRKREVQVESNEWNGWERGKVKGKKSGEGRVCVLTQEWEGEEEKERR